MNQFFVLNFLIVRPMEPPPKPPGFNKPPPPRPTKSESNRDLFNLPHNSDSGDQMMSQDVAISNARSETQLHVLGGNHFSPSRLQFAIDDPPPLPPHRNPPTIPKQQPIVKPVSKDYIIVNRSVA